MWGGIFLFLLHVSQMCYSAAVFIGECNPLVDFVTLFSCNTYQNCMTKVKFCKHLWRKDFYCLPKSFRITNILGKNEIFNEHRRSSLYHHN